MLKIITMIITLLLAIAAFAGFYVVNQKVQAGEKLLAAGQQQYDAGAQKLKAGKAKLAQGKQKLGTVKTIYQAAPVAEIANATPIGAAILGFTHHQIKGGEKQVATGERQVKAGEAKLAAGKKALAEGREQLAQGKRIRDGLFVGGIFFALLTFVLGIFWKRKNTSCL
ncbi:MAG: hypothetical protein ACD_70C00006G0002 [uncultured bacterium]|nr:MAG: hypothetical protein ACD_70C00006G0002 [uncultured bacterium]OGT26391.1 MAG: hypothetical protein A3B71_01555 [Gammaproteobacteria bacterium RIFCSPHIGHO2_02_FULL_42_43]OGT27353.1 MAG: hypothetical protein A2624_04810 [Gammaproteobacteria bacterium RIFCSPHIGHO2_01_FULL_42_8]OGT52662.1 MAG: hypothetical protein A3E54_07250 [Gammaproteobacteria bacterium RIFCSPHIGHO2_12_FULL_41_25]OGT62879.1 MAG: hypothetical protein A3I77_01035 [Gammaproteobacteria bacterium RIFCSPLOWO2_02_FULL_42_14]OGT